ncbi:hypothetical protein DICPUDRAFT_87156 [Dictyostelium purpureum]|uniref:PARP-type domain-containing protein n=1 Tax=Dictyostelium purpureum TaxID=5786 RepID=F0ZGB9_DICPU|nr:uncharacterized protein DICPUDRAFT_87156 [Dictyostelium purpureum]EGC37015.1 hypothetical protein DICPUDRAFT_87156 [Dictyostelium purpureum]|eukprot:XP_003286443.1 hypothetical protein DICPUDRAFT_87156 [Dictyostelium purpureum]
MSNNTYRVEYAGSGRSSCKHSKCKKQIEKTSLRIGKLYPSDRFETDGQAIDWFHPNCFFEKQKNARKTTKKVDEIDDLEGFDDIKKSDQKLIEELINDHRDSILSKPKSKSKSKPKAKESKPTKSAASSWFVDDSGNIANSDDEDSHKNKSTSKHNHSKKQAAFEPNEQDDDDIFDDVDASKSLTSTVQSTKTSASTSKSNKKPFLLSSVLSKKWFDSLDTVLTQNKPLFEEIVGEKRNSSYLPISSQIFSSLNFVGSPKDCKVVFFGLSPNNKKETSCGFSFCDASADKWKLYNIKASTKNLIRAALIDRGFITKDDTLDSIQEALKEVDLPSDNPRDWFKSTAKQGVLWLNSSLTSVEDEDKVPVKVENYWKPVVNEIIRAIFNNKLEEENPSPTVVVLLGKQLSQLKNEIELIHSEFMGAVPVEYVEGVSPFLETFLNENYFKKINSYLETHGSKPIDWWKPKEDDEEEEEQEEQQEEQHEEQHEEEQQEEKGMIPEKKIGNKKSNIFDQDDFEEGPKDIDMEEKPIKSKSKSSSQPSNDFLSDTAEDIKPESKPICNLIQENGDKIQLKLDEPFTLGRNILEIKDKLVSRNQAVIKFVKSFSDTYCVELTPKGQNPIHIDKNGSLEPLAIDTPIYLNDGQQFLLCSQKYPFTVQLIKPSSTPKKQTPTKQAPTKQTPTKQTPSKQVTKRKYDDFEEEPQHNTKSTSSTKKVATESKPKPKSKPKKKDDFIDFEEEDDSGDDYIPSGSDDDSEFVGLKPFVKSRSQDKPACKYWDTCYRNNPQHFKDFRHP